MSVDAVDDYISELKGWKAETASELRRLVRDTVPTAAEALKWGQPTFEHRGMLCYFKAFKHHINFGFFCGTELDDPDNLLEGTGKTMRHVKLTASADMAYYRPKLAALLASAAELNRKENGEIGRRDA